MSWAVGMALLALLLLVIAPVLGLIFYSPARAAAVRQAEQLAPLVTVQVAYLRMRHADMARDRLDRHVCYVWLHLIIGIYGFIVLFVRLPASNLGSAALGTKHALAWSLIVGAAFTLIGSILGTHKRIRIGRWVYQHLFCEILGDDIRVPYTFGWCGMLSTAMSMGFYIYTVGESAGYDRIITSLGGLTSIAVLGMCVIMVPQFVSRMTQYVQARDMLSEEALTRIIEENT